MITTYICYTCRSVSDGFKYVSVTPQFPMSLRSTRYGKSKPKPVPCPLKEIDVLVAVGDSEINGDDSDSSLLKKVMFEKFKVLCSFSAAVDVIG